MAQRTPNDPAWYKGGLVHDDATINVPGLWFMSWYDVSIGPNLALYNHVRKTAKPGVADQQWAIIAPVAHCAYTRATEDTIVGERSMGDARYDYNDIVYGFFDRFLKGDKGGRLDRLAEGHLLHDGLEQVANIGHLAARRRAADDVLPVERRQREHAERRRRVGDRRAGRRQARHVHLRPDEAGDVVRRQRLLHGERHHRRVRSTSARWRRGPTSSSSRRSRSRRADAQRADRADALRVVGREGHRLHREGARRLPDGRAYNLDESIQRMRYRDGYDKPLVWMEPGKVYKVTLQPLTTSNYFAPGHRLRIEVSSSNFPRFDRNLNTGGNNYDEAKGVVAHNSVHHSKMYPSQITVTVVRK